MASARETRQAETRQAAHGWQRVASIVYVAVPGRNPTLFRCAFRLRYSAVAQYFC